MTQIVFKKKCNPGAVSIIVPLTGHSKLLKISIEKIEKHTPKIYERIFVNRGNTPPKWLMNWVKKRPNDHLIEALKGTSRAECMNMGIEASSGEFIVIMQEHVMVSDGWLNGMLECIDGREDIGIVGPMTDAETAGIQCAVDSAHAKINPFDEFARGFRKKNRFRRIRSRQIADFCTLFRWRLVEQIGPFDETLEQGSEFDDYCLRAALEGYHNLIAGDVMVHCGKIFPVNNKRAFKHKWRGIDARSRDGKRLAVLIAVEAAEKLHHRGDIDKAIVMMIEGIKYRPEKKAIYHGLAGMLIDAGRFKEALEAINAAPDDKGDDLTTIELSGYCNEGMKRYDEAARCADRALSLNASSAPALNLRGMLAHQKGNRDAAKDFFKAAIASDPGYGDSHTNLGILSWEAGHQDNALELLEKGFILSPTVEGCIRAYHFVVSEMAQFKRAESVFREAKALFPQHRRIAFLLIDILIQQKKHASAMREIREAMVAFGINDGILSAANGVLDRIDAEKTKDARKKPNLSLCMIVKNEEKYLAKCLMSALPIADEMIVVDTGSTDRTRAIAKIFGAELYDFEWCNDFSRARNLSLSKAAGRWIFVMDADEVISPLDYAALTRIVKKRHDDPEAYFITTRNYVRQASITGWTCNDGQYADEEAGTGWWPTRKVRLFTNHGFIRFENPIHELVEPSLIRRSIHIRECNIPVHHYGQLNEDQHIAKREAYYLLAKKKVAEEGDNIHFLIEFAIEAGGLEKYEEAVELWKRALRINPFNAKALLSLGYTYMKLKNYEEARVSARKAMLQAPTLKEVAVLHTTCELLFGNTGKSVSCLEKLLQETPEYPMARSILAATYRIEGEKAKSLKQIRTLTKMGVDCAEYLHDLSGKLVSTGRTGDAVSLLELAVESGHDTKDIREFLSELK